jgi:asparagine synthase (glutamine-hydrolysing)
MCGIAGYYGRSDTSVPALETLERMIGTLGHRGPDAKGVHADSEAGLAHARLSIIDIATGQQPMSNSDGTIWITFNGEVFNYVELRRDLIARGRRFRTDSDTEVIIQLYEEMGADCVTMFNGDFAFAIWDSRRNLFMLARDRAGVRPLYYTNHGGRLYFASEVKALLEAPGVTAEIDPIALDQIFTLWVPLSPRTPFRNISELPPAYVLIASPQGTQVRPYWRLSYPEARDESMLDRRAEGEIAEDLNALLVDATRIRLRSDVPVGAYLSGGLDSSLITAMMKALVPERLRTFSVKFESGEFDESAFQGEMVRALATKHTSVTCTTADIGRLFPEVIRHVERPILRTAPAPLFALSAHVHANGFKVVLTGEGADEVFGGYDIFKEAKVRRFCAAQPRSRRRLLLLQRLYPYLPALKNQSQKYLEAFFSTAADDTADPLFSHLPRFRTTAGAKNFFSAELRDTLRGYDALAELREQLPSEFSRWHPLSQAQYLETAYLLPGYILSSQGDRVAMAHSVEGRFPFLDHRVIEFGARLPPRLKLRTLREKHILRQAAGRLLLATIADRPKQPYRAPDSQPFVGPQAPAFASEMLASDRISALGLFEPRAVEKLVRKCSTQSFVGFRDNMAFVGILSTQILGRQFFQAGGLPQVSSVA